MAKYTSNPPHGVAAGAATRVGIQCVDLSNGPALDLRTALQEHLGQAYHIDRELGGGGMSRVFVASEARLARDVVVKVLSPELSQGLSVERFEREILLAASLQQANIVPVLAAGDVSGLPYFVMPFVEGQSLRSQIRDGGLPIGEILAILRDVTKALAYAHARGIVHRDIKPDNVLLSGGTAVVTDFGIAKAISAAQGGADRPELASDPSGTALTMVGTSIGSPPYMAPEQVAADPDVDHRADLYSLGCMAYELLTGRTPFAEHGKQRLLAAHLSELPRPVTELRSDTPPELARLVERLLAKAPGDRPTDAGMVLKTLDGVDTTSASLLSLERPGMLVRVLVSYILTTAVVAILAKAAIVGIGLPDWTLTGAIIVMLLGLPPLLFTLWVKWAARRGQLSRTPGGSAGSTGTMTNLAVRANRHLSLRRTIRGGLYAMATFVVVVTAFMVTRAMGIGPAASLFAAGQLAADDKLVLADLQASSADSALAVIVAQAVRSALSQSHAVSIVEPATVADLLEEMRRSRTSALDAGTARDIAMRAGAKAVLGGRLARAGQGYAISLVLTAADGGAILASAQGTASEGELIEVTDRLTRKLRGKIGESLREVQRSVPLARATTANLEALRKYTEGAYANDVERDYDKSARLLREAVTLDTSFALAWRKLAVARSNAQMSSAARDSALAQAARFSDRLPPLERHLVMASYYELHSSQYNDPKGLEEYRAAVAIDSNNTTAVNGIYRLTTDSIEALRYAELQYRLRPVLANRIMLYGARMAAADTVGAIATLDSIRAATPADTATEIFIRAAAGLAISQRDWAGAISLLKQILPLPGIPGRIYALEKLGTLEQMTGRLAEARAHQDEWGRLSTARGALDFGPLWEANRDIRFRGRGAEGVRRIQAVVNGKEWAAALPVDRYYVDVIDLYGRAGRLDLAQDMMASWERDAPERFAANSPAGSLVRIAKGSILRAQGKYAEAAAQFRGALIRPDGTPAWYPASILLNLGDTFDRMGQIDSVVAVYQRFLALDPAVQLEGDAAADGLALIHKRLGEIAESRGDRATALAHYSSFIDLWQHADLELQPVVGDVRRRITELRNVEGQ